MNVVKRNSLLLLAFLGVCIALYFVINHDRNGGAAEQSDISYSRFISKVENGKVTSIRIEGDTLKATISSTGENVVVIVPEGENVIERVSPHNVSITYISRSTSGSSQKPHIFLSLIPVIVFLVIYFAIMRGVGTKGDQDNA